MLTLHLNDVLCERLSPPELSTPYKLEVFAPIYPSNMSGFGVVFDDLDVNRETTYLTLNRSADVVNLLTADLRGINLPDSIKITAPNSGENCISTLTLGVPYDPKWKAVSFSDFKDCPNFCKSNYKAADGCVIISSQAGRISSITLNINAFQGCENLKVEVSPGVDNLSVCSFNQTVSTSRNILEAFQQLNDRNFSDASLVMNNIDALDGVARFFDTLILLDFYRLSLEYIGASDGNKTIAVLKSTMTLIKVGCKSELKLIGVTIESGVISNRGGTVQIYDCLFKQNATLENTNNGLIQANKIQMVVDGKGAIKTANSSRTEIYFGTFYKAQGSMLTSGASKNEIFNDDNSTTLVEYSTLPNAKLIRNNGGDVVELFSKVTVAGCFDENRGPLGSFKVSLAYGASQCEAICVANRLCQSFRVLFEMDISVCELYDSTYIFEQCKKYGEVYIDLTKESFPSKKFASFVGNISLSAGIMVPAISIQPALHSSSMSALL